MKGSEICNKLEEQLYPILETMGYELVYINFLKENRNWILRISIDKIGGVTLKDCELVSHAIDSKVEEMDLIKRSYLLEVCSPGLDRPLIKDIDFMRFQGKKIKLKTKEPIENRKNFTGLIREFKEGMLKLELTDGEGIFVIPGDKIQKANLVIEI
ncbi:MAG TPA: ribosome maturation factor RimP [Candidatus Eremiobacteraeota bacterium]|nr:MAG: Ribosome maturation factor RimP [bacterium ADurb.Bin363]HPZ10438.1 ribosome maturation factor RimP [Candidatus Eremiobacteraeota bacterium]